MGRSKVHRSNADRQKKKCESRKHHQHQLRRAMAISEYLLLSATEQHRQATVFVDQLEEKYPNKRDVRKTPEFRNWQREQLLLIGKQPPAQIPEDSTNTVKEMVLRIPLMNDSTETKQTPTVPDMPGEIHEDELATVFDEIPADIMSEMMAEIRADPNLCALMNDFNLDLYEEVVDQGTVPDRLEDEINSLIPDPLEDEIISFIPDPLEDEINSLIYF